MKGLNLGCGTRFHPAWTNVDVSPVSPHVRICDVQKGLPFSDETFDVVYHSHLLEHLPREAALPFIKECYRVLRRGGIIRVAVPDLERIARLYLRTLNKVLTADAESRYDYTWIMLELYDQTVRDKPGGAMLEYLQQNPIPNERLVYERLGEEARQIISRLRENDADKTRDSLWRRRLNHIYSLRDRMRAALVRCLLGRHDYNALMLGRFRLSGEIHQWMYDRYSLALLLEQSGFGTRSSEPDSRAPLTIGRSLASTAIRTEPFINLTHLWIEAIRPITE